MPLMTLHNRTLLITRFKDTSYTVNQVYLAAMKFGGFATF